ncbi:MAG: glycosyltransferase family 2 protein, partial [Acidobacteriota bacterium]
MNDLGKTPRKLSVIIACLNAASTLRDQLDGLAGQTWSGDWERDWEVIVADNGSTDGSQALVESYRGRIPGLRVVDASDRKGQAHARNVGSVHATGDALLFVDADDQVAPGWLEALAAALSRHAFVACRYDNQALNPAWVQRPH